MAITWYLDVDWDNDGSYEADEAGRLTDLSISRGRKNYISTSGNGIQPVKIGKLTAKLDNYDGRYDAWNTSSPLYDDVAPGRLVRVRVTDGVDTHTIFSGKIADIVPRGGLNAYVDLVAYDGVSWLIDRGSTTELYSDIDADAAIGHVLDSVDWPAEWGRALDDGPDNIPYWWADGEGAYQYIIDLADSGMGRFFIAADGKATYYNRQKDIAASYDLTQADLTNEIRLPQPWDSVRNIITVQANPLDGQSTQVLWTLQAPLLMDGAALYEIWATYTYSGVRCPAENVVSPVATTDYTANTDANGTGTDKTGSVSVFITKYAGASKLTYINLYDDPIYLTLAQLRGDPMARTDKITYVAEVEDYATNPRSMTLDLPPLQDSNNARDFAEYLAGAIGSPRPFPQISMIDQFDKQFSVDLFDVIGVELDKYGIDEDFQIGGIEHRWADPNGQGTKTTFYLEPFISYAGFWNFPTKLGETSVLGW